MPNLLQVQGLSKSYGARSLLKDAAFAVNEGEHIGVIGPNGAGKTTLFKILVGLEDIDTGELTKKRGLRVGYLQQHDKWSADETCETYLSNGCVIPIWDLKSLGIGLGLQEEIYSQKILSLSGGYRMRLKLLHLLGEDPDILLLDEPTNYLDLESILVLERFLQDYKHAFLLISHDREFLRRCTDHTLEVEGGEITKYPGNIDDYFEQKTLLRSQLEARAMNLEQKKKEVLDFVNRFKAKASKARQAQSRLKSLERMETIEIKALASRAVIRIPAPAHCGKEVLSLNNVTLGYGEKTILSQLNLNILRGDHIGVVGVNGIGKSTLLKALGARLLPLKGEVKVGYQVSIGYYAQHVGEALDPNSTVLQSMAARAHPDVFPQDVLNLAGALLFSGDDVHKKISLLSGGEKSRVALGQILLQKSPCLLLDEPTNHLDFDTVEALTEALRQYEGTVVVVSHDRGFVSRVAQKIFEIRDGRVHVYQGTYDEYVWSLQKGSLAQRYATQNFEASINSHSSSSSNNSSKYNFKEIKKTLEKELRKVETNLKDMERHTENSKNKLLELTELLTTPNSDKSKVSLQLAETQKQLDAAEEECLELMEQRESLLSKITGL